MGADAGTAVTPLRDAHESAGARYQKLRGVERPRHYGDPRAEYGAAADGVAVVDRSHRERWRITGRDPVRMLDGIVTNAIPDPPDRESGGRAAGTGAYGTILTPKGKMVVDHRLFRWGGEVEDAFLLELPPAGAEGLRAHFEKYLPPLFARVDEITADTGMLTVLGPDGAALLAREVAEGALDEAELRGMEEHDFFLLGRDPAEAVRVVRTGEAGVPAFDLMADASTVSALWHGLREAGAAAAGFGAWETLRVEAGRPAFGSDLDDSTIPVEAGIHRRAIDYDKGCYTGQEVIVRIRDRGRVNWHLRGLLLGDVPAPEPDTELFRSGEERRVGRTTSAVQSPRYGQVAALGYVRREVEPPARLRLGAPDGPEVRVRKIGPDGWWGEEGTPPDADSGDG